MASRWSGLRGKVEPFALDQEFQDKVNSVKSSYVGLTAPEMARMFVINRDAKKGLETSIKALNVELEALSQLLVENLEGSATAKLTTDTGLTVYIQSEPYSSIENKEEVVQYLTRHKMRSMLTVQWNVMNATNKERLTNGEGPLPGTKIFLKSSARIRGNSEEER